MQNPLDEIKAAFQSTIADYKSAETQVVNPNARRTLCKKFYVSADEDAQIRDARQGVKESGYFRAKVLGKLIPRPRTVIPQINRDTYDHIAGIRGSLNQIARAVNTAAKNAQTLPLTERYLDEIKQLESLLVEVQLQLSQAHDLMRDGDDWQD